MALLIKIGQERDLPKEPANWPQCGDYIPRLSSTAVTIRIRPLSSLPDFFRQAFLLTMCFIWLALINQ